MSRLAKASDYRGESCSVKPIALAPLPDQPLVSILISNYNYGSYLGDAIESVLHQTYRNLEVVICDDGSRDASPEILERYRLLDARIKVLSEPNGGQSVALNTAFCESAGEIICLLDADDVFMPDKVELVVNAFAAAPNSGFAVHRMMLVDKARKYLAEIPSLYKLPSGWQGTHLSSSGPRVLPGLPPTSGLSLRRSAAEAIFPLPAALRAYSDTLIQVVAPLATPIVAVSAPLSEYRVHGSNIASVSRFTEGLLRNIVLCEKEIWFAWRRYLASARSGLPPDFPLPAEMAPSLMDYAYARFRSDKDFAGTYKVIPAAYLQSLPRHLQWYWRTSRMFPGWLFRRSFDFVYGQPRSKMVARRIIDTCRKGLSGRDTERNS